MCLEKILLEGSLGLWDDPQGTIRAKQEGAQLYPDNTIDRYSEGLAARLVIID